MDEGIKVFYPMKDGHKDVQFVTCWFNNGCQLEREEHPDHLVEYHYLPDGNKYEEITTYNNGDTYRVRYDYDDEGGLIGTVKVDKYGGIVAKSEYDWIKPYRVAQIKNYQYQGDAIELSQETYYYRKDGQLKFKRGLERFTKYEYDDNGLLIKEIESYCVDSGEDLIWLTKYWVYNKDGLIVEYTDELGNVSTMKYEYEKDGDWPLMEARADGVLKAGWTVDGDHISCIITRKVHPRSEWRKRLL